MQVRDTQQKIDRSTSINAELNNLSGRSLIDFINSIEKVYEHGKITLKFPSKRAGHKVNVKIQSGNAAQSRSVAIVVHPTDSNLSLDSKCSSGCVSVFFQFYF